MKALTVKPGQPGAVGLSDVPEPRPEAGDVLVQTLAVGVCGTDREIIAGEYGTAPPGDDYLILGHESLGRVLEAPPDSQLKPGDLVVGIVRLPDPVPCLNCAVGEWDMCRNGKYTEHGIKERHGFCAERFRLSADFLVKLDPALDRVGVLLEPASIVAKAWDHIERIGSRSRWQPRRVLVTGAGPVGLLAALLGVQRDLEVHVVDLATEGPKPQLVRDLGAQYHVGKIAEVCPGADVVLECTGASQLVYEVMRCNAPGAVVCLTGLSSGGRSLSADVGGMNNSMVLGNDVVFGSVNANRRHYDAAARALARADRGWLERLLTRRVPLARWQEILERPAGDIKTVIDLTA